MQNPGWKTSEFWITLVIISLSAFWGSGVVGDGSQTDRIFGFIASVAQGLGYTMSRGIAKAKLPPGNAAPPA